MRFAILSLFLLWPVLGHAAYEDKVGAKLRWLDKITARTGVIELKKGDTYQYGDLTIRLQGCRAQDPLEGADSAAFVQLWEKKADEDPEWVFSGWMFASSPGVSAVDHPVYDVWLLNCLDTMAVNDDGSIKSDGQGESGRETP